MHKVDYFSNNWIVIKINNKNIENNLSIVNGVVYDLGCGERPYEKDILNLADQYIGVDWGQTLHDLMADVVADLNKKLPLESEIANTVVSFQVLEHLCEPQIMLDEAYRILKHNGNILLTVPFQWWVHEAPYDYYRYTPYGLKYMFEKAGFADIEIIAATGFFVMWVSKLNYFTARFIRGPKWIRMFIKYFMLSFWFFSRLLAQFLDNLDKQPELEAGGYVVTARKPN